MGNGWHKMKKNESYVYGIGMQQKETKGFVNAVKTEIPLLDLLFNGGCVCYSDNSTGTDYNNSIKNLTSGES